MADEQKQEEPVTFRDRRKVDPETGEARPATDGADTAGAADTVAPAGDGEQVAGPADGEDPEVEKLRAEVAERTADLQRVSAEYANYRRRADRDREQTKVDAKVSFANDLLVVLDDFERAAQHGDLTGPFKAAADKVTTVLTKLGLEPFGTEGESFDPQLHEAVQHEPADGSGPTVTVLSTVLRRGYRISDRVLRPAMVTVQDRPEAPAGGGADAGDGEPQNPA
ncbi:nucleotide exchange factor GrpE [Pseudonocardia alni]|uniref:nucleotide exchange factor GrpE n=1 Tax=Pseudonocardia alni TaxID=33907 RepID=UPI003408FF96